MENSKEMEVSQLNQYFDKIIYINRKGRVDRYKNITKRLKELSIVAERFCAIEGGHIDRRKLRFENTIKKLDNGEIGCFLSHRAIWEKAKKEGWGKTLILEDDAIFTKHFKPEILKDIPEWDMLYLGQHNYDFQENGGNEHGGKTYALKKEVKPGIWKADRCWLTHAYAINYDAIDYLLENTENMYSSVDNVLADIQKVLKVYAVAPNFLTQDGSKSDLRKNNF